MVRHFWRLAGVAFLAVGIATACQAGGTTPPTNPTANPNQRNYPSPSAQQVAEPTPTVIYLTPPRR
ncbi:MAG: hypothetical protein U0556_18940 [Dehalococcoidia bacterium]